MRTKFLLPMLFLSLGAFFLVYCAKEPLPNPVTTTAAPDETATERASCTVYVKTTCDTKICGTETNLNPCTFCTGGSGFGTVLQPGGTSTSYVVTPTTKMWFGNPNSTTCTVKISINGVVSVFTLAPGEVKEIKIYDDCSYVGPFAC
ncbi:MAG: hypothetical protein JNL02_04270 [Saprospiraceae bacterium]|nr:hypothetical protein [Saprospiraceae bacterium]